MKVCGRERGGYAKCFQEIAHRGNCKYEIFEPKRKTDSLEIARDRLRKAEEVIAAADEVERHSSLTSTPEQWREALGRYRTARLLYSQARGGKR
jgi:hypothetical protein